MNEWITINGDILMKTAVLYEAFVKPALKASVCICFTGTKNDNVRSS
jgi:hypothetical protein